MALLENTLEPDQVNAADYDAIYFTGGHAVMYDFPDSQGLQRITREIWDAGGIVSSVCHGYCGLLNTTLTDGSYLITSKRITGFAWQEEVLAGVDKLVPYNAEQEAKDRGARYEKAKLPFVSYTVTDGNLITGQNPGSAKETATVVAAVLEDRDKSLGQSRNPTSGRQTSGPASSLRDEPGTAVSSGTDSGTDRECGRA